MLADGFAGSILHAQPASQVSTTQNVLHGMALGQCEAEPEVQRPYSSGLGDQVLKRLQSRTPLWRPHSWIQLRIS